MTHNEENRDFSVTAEHMAPHILVARAAEAPDEVILQDVETGRTWTSSQLLDESQRWATALAAAGVSPGDRVATMLPDPATALISWIGSCLFGAIEASVNPQHRGELLQAILTTVEPQAVVVDAEVYRGLSQEELEGVGLVLTTGGEAIEGAVDIDELRHAPPAAFEPRAWAESDTAVIILTSGTTGPSKGVVVPWSTCFQLVSWVPAEALRAGEAVFCPLPMFHLAGRSTFTTAMARRARYVFRRKFSASAFLNDVRSTGSVMANVVGPMVSYLHALPPSPDDEDSPLRVVVCGPLIPEIEQFKARFGVDVVTCYGMTEIGSVLTTTVDHGPWNSCGRVRLSYPWPQVRIVDDDENDVESGAVGELVVRPGHPTGFSPGYLDDADKTAEAWRGGWFHTGDAFRVDDEGNYYLVDRHADTIRRRGENVSSYEIETALGSHPSVVECAAVAAPGAHGDDDIVVFLIATNDGVDEAELARWAESRMPRHMWPSRYVMVRDLPRNATSLRVKKYELRTMAMQGQVGTSNQGRSGAETVPSANPLDV